MTSVDISQSSLSLAFMAASQAEEALSVMLGFVPQFFNARSQVVGLQGPTFVYVRSDETNNGLPTLYFWDGALLKQLTSSADVAAAAAAAQASAQAAAASVANLPSLVVQQVATHASLPASPVGLYLVLADETRGGVPSLYYFWATHCMWFAALQVA